jgi:hypothetical protein
LLVVQVLDAVFYLAQKGVGLGQRVRGGSGHEVGVVQPHQCVQRGAAAQFGESTATHHLQQLHGEFDFADAAAREFDVVRTLGVSGGALAGVLADLAVQAAQGFEHAVVEVAAEHERQHHTAQGVGRAARDGGTGRHHAALEPRKAFPFAPLHQEVFLQRAQRHRRRAGAAVGAQHQIDTEHVAVFGGVAHQRVDAFDGLGKVFVVGDAVAPGAVACGLAVHVVDVDQVDVAGDVELARAKLAHADDPQLGALEHRALCGHHGGGHGRVFVQRRAIEVVEFQLGLGQGFVQRQLGQLGHGAGDDVQRRGAFGVEHHQTLDHQMAQHAQCRAQLQPLRTQGGQGGAHHVQRGSTGGQQGEFLVVAAADALHKAGMFGHRWALNGKGQGRLGHGIGVGRVNFAGS